MTFNAFTYRAIFTMHSGGEYPPISVAVKLSDAMAKILMATPIKTVHVAVHRAGGIVMDETPEPLEFHDGGNKPKLILPAGTRPRK